MAGLNKAIIIGHLGHSPEIKMMQTGGRIANLSVATSESWKDKITGERKERTEWHRVVVYNDALVGIIEKYVSKGSKIYIEGQLESRKYTGRDGIERQITEITLRPYRGEIVLLDKKEAELAPANTAMDDDEFNDDIPF